MKHETLLFFISVQTKVGTWNSLDKLNLARVEEATTGDGIDHPMANKTFVIVGVLVNYSLHLFHLKFLTFSTLESPVHNVCGVIREAEWE